MLQEMSCHRDRAVNLFGGVCAYVRRLGDQRA
jgi:hypothetical protein